MFHCIRRWYEGEAKVRTYPNDPSSALYIFPSPYAEYHWTAKFARALVVFYLEHWKWIWTTVIAVVAIVWRTTRG